jgi:hypothetical protein
VPARHGPGSARDTGFDGRAPGAVQRARHERREWCTADPGPFHASMPRAADSLPRAMVVPLTYVMTRSKLTYMEKTQVYLRKEELDALRKAAARSGRSVAALVRDAIRKVVLKPQGAGPVAIWDGTPRRTSREHDSVHDEP